LADLANIKAGEISTLYVPPLGPAAIDEPISPFFLAPSSVSHRRRAST
jgi:hypothetical protein